MLRKLIVVSSVVTLGMFSGCSSDETPSLQVPSSYDFLRNGTSSVYYQGQVDRLDQLAEMKNYVKTGDAGESLDADVLVAMFENTGGDGDGNFTFTSDRQLKDKAFLADVGFFQAVFEAAEAASESEEPASEGVAGLIYRSNGNTILVDGNGHEFTQTLEKGIMGSVFLNQIFNVYLTESRIGEGVENTELEDGTNYTKMEHHWDEAFGYFGVPVDFPSNPGRFWGAYSNSRDALLGTNQLLMDAFKTGRAAIVAKRHSIKNEQREIIYDGLELIAAASAVHYLKEAKSSINEGEVGDALHVLTEGYMFIRALRVSPRGTISLADLTEILEEDLGENFWEIIDSDLSGIDRAIDTLVEAFPELESVKDVI